MSEDANNLHECLDVIGKEPNAFARVHLLWDAIDAVTNYPHQHKNSHLVGDILGPNERNVRSILRENFGALSRKKKETLNLLKSCAYMDGAKCKVAANKLLRTLTVKIKESPRHEKIEEYQIDDTMRAIKRASLRATQHPEPLSRADLHKIDQPLLYEWPRNNANARRRKKNVCESYERRRSATRKD